MNSANILQAVRGPIMLITVGVLIVLDYNTPFTFGHTWPVLFIVFGVLKLLERMASPPQPPAPPLYTAPPGFGPGTGYQAPPGTYTGSGYQQPATPPQGPGGTSQ